MAPKAEGPTLEEEAQANTEAFRRDAYARDFERLDALFHNEVHKGKPIVDYVAMLGVLAVASSLLISALQDHSRVGYAERSSSIIIFCLVTICVLGYRAALATSAQLERLLLLILNHFMIRHPDDWGSETLKGLWRSLVLACAIIVGGTVLGIGDELSRTARRIGDPTAVTRVAPKPPASVTEGWVSPTDDRHVAP